MKESIIINPRQTEDNNFHPTTVLMERLEQLGYQCITDSCKQFTTLRLVPIETKRKEEVLAPPSE